jgi:hypothetical protein
VRLPVLKELKCPATVDLACKLSGANLFLVDSVSSDPKFTHPVQVPDGFPGYSMPVPHPTDGNLYVKLRDDPTVVNLTMLGAQQLPPTVDETARAAERHAAHAEPEPAPAVPAQQGGTKSTVLSSSSSGEAPPASPPPPAAPPTGSVQQATAPAVATQQTPTLAEQGAAGAQPTQSPTAKPTKAPAGQTVPAAAAPAEPASQPSTPAVQSPSAHGAAATAPVQPPAG